jgi:hypothetical protein
MKRSNHARKSHSPGERSELGAGHEGSRRVDRKSSASTPPTSIDAEDASREDVLVASLKGFFAQESPFRSAGEGSPRSAPLTREASREATVRQDARGGTVGARVEGVPPASVATQPVDLTGLSPSSLLAVQPGSSEPSALDDVPARASSPEGDTAENPDALNATWNVGRGETSEPSLGPGQLDTTPIVGISGVQGLEGHGIAQRDPSAMSDPAGDVGIPPGFDLVDGASQGADPDVGTSSTGSAGDSSCVTVTPGLLATPVLGNGDQSSDVSPLSASSLTLPGVTDWNPVDSPDDPSSALGRVGSDAGGYQDGQWSQGPAGSGLVAGEGTGVSTVELAKINELLQELLDEVRRGRPAYLPVPQRTEQ